MSVAFLPVRILVWRCIALVALLLGIVGLVLPVIPTAPFLLVSAWAAGKGWPALEERLLAHPVYGVHIRAWREHGAVPRIAKVMATLMIAVSCIGLQFSGGALWLKIGVPALLACLLIWLWTRPEPKDVR